jgi:hypothetical protein
MDRFEALKQEISAMNLNDFMRIYVDNDDVKDFICSDIKVPYAHCIGHQEYNCTECIKAYLESEVNK